MKLGTLALAVALAASSLAADWPQVNGVLYCFEPEGYTR